MRDVFIFRTNVCRRLLLTVSCRSNPVLPSKFSLTLSNTTILLLIEYPITVKRATTTEIFNSKSLNVPTSASNPRGRKTSWKSERREAMPQCQGAKAPMVLRKAKATYATIIKRASPAMTNVFCLSSFPITGPMLSKRNSVARSPREVMICEREDSGTSFMRKITRFSPVP